MSQGECPRRKGNLMVSQPIIFTDLDGTLLDHETYSFSAAMPALELLREECIPLVFCSSKTRAEIEIWRKRLENRHPFICENGGGIFIPISYFAEDDIRAVWQKIKKVDGYHVLVLGTPYPLLRETLKDLRLNGFDVKGFGDMSTKEVAETTGLRREEAELAKEREFDEPFIFQGDQREIETLLDSIREEGLRCSQGRFYHLMGENDKGKAVEMLKGLYQRKLGDITTIALVDSPVDFPMLEKVDYPILVRNYKGEHDRRISLPNLIKAEGIGPEGWNRAVLSLIRDGV
jgi:mannosyl-3-phosphoglycerate phosphatase family protein